MNCCKTTGVSSTVLGEVERIVDGIDGVLGNRVRKITWRFLLNSNGELLYSSGNENEAKKTELSNIVKTLKEEIERTTDSFEISPPKSFHIFGANQMFSCFVTATFTLGFYSETQRVALSKSKFDAAEYEEVMADTIQEITLKLNQLEQE